MKFKRKLRWLILVLMSLFLFAGCGDLEPDMQDTRTVILNMDFHGKSSSRSSSSVSASELSQYNTHLILALPSWENLTSSYKNFYSSFAQGLMNTADKKVSLEIPLNTQMKIFAFLFEENYSMSELFPGTREVGYYGESQTFSIGTQTNNLSLSITLIQVPGTGTDTGGETDTTDTTAPTVSSVYPADNQNEVSITENISVTFSEAMNTTSVTTNMSNTTCSGSFQLSSNNFSSCIQMSSSPSSSNSYRTFTVDPSNNLSNYTNYKIRVTTGVKDTGGNTLSSQYETLIGFTTSSDNSSNSSDNSSSSGSGVFVGVGNSGKIVRSTDNGSSFTNVTPRPSKYLYGVTFGNNTFVGVGDNGNIVRSTDNGSSWDNATSPITTAIKGVTFSE